MEKGRTSMESKRLLEIINRRRIETVHTHDDINQANRPLSLRQLE